jgi:hypothetical protein
MIKSLWQATAIGTLFFLACPFARGAGCERVLGVAQVIMNASKLDGQVICVRGLVFPAPVPQWSGELFQELVPLPTKPETTPSTSRLGLLEWSPETGVDEKYYRPESFALLSRKNANTRLPAHLLDVTFRGAVMYKRHLRATLPPIASTTPEIEAMRHARYEVELVLLEIVRSRVPTGVEKNR